MSRNIVDNKQSEQLADKESTQSEQLSNKQLYQFSKVVYGETYIDGALMSSGNQKEKFLQKIEKNSKYAKRNAAMTKSMSCFFIIIMDIFNLLTFHQISKIIPLIDMQNFDWYIFSFSMSLNMLVFIQMIFLITLSMPSLMGLFADGNAFKWLETFPFSRNEISKIVLFTFFRSMNIQIIVIFFGLPIIATIAVFLFGLSAMIILSTLLISFLNLLFTLGILIIVSNYMSKKVFSNENISKKESIIKMVFMVGYLGTYVGMSMLISQVPGWIIDLFAMNPDTDLSLINGLLSFIPFPFGMSYFLGLSMIPINLIPFEDAWMMILGFIFSIIITFLLFKKAFRVLSKVSQDDRTSSTGELIEITEISFSIKNPKKAIIVKDLKVITRDFGLIMYLIFPIFIPLMGIISALSESSISSALNMMNGMFLIFSIQGLIFILMAVTGSEGNSGNFLQVLSIDNYIVYKAKKQIMIIILVISMTLPNLLLINKFPTESILIALNLIYQIITTLYLIEFILGSYAFCFGKIRNEYKLEIINQRFKALKTFLIVFIIFGLIFGPFLFEVLMPISRFEMDLNLVYITKIIYAFILYVLFWILATRIFKKPKKAK